MDKLKDNISFKVKRSVLKKLGERLEEVSLLCNYPPSTSSLMNGEQKSVGFCGAIFH